MNSAVVKVQYPDGCRGEWRTRNRGPVATNTIAFGHWLIALGEDIVEGATTEGQHKAKLRAGEGGPQEER